MVKVQYELRTSSNNSNSVNIAEPLCSGGDFIAKNYPMDSNISMGDKLIEKNIGANSFTLWFKYCSRPFPKVIMYKSSEIENLIQVIKDRETLDNIVKFWS